MRLIRWAWAALVAVIGLIVLLWSFGAVSFDAASNFLAAAQTAAVLAVVIFLRPLWLKGAMLGLWFVLLLSWWFSLEPSNDRDWQPDVEQTAWAEIKGDEVTLHNIRNCIYRTETDFTPQWETRTVRLSQITGVDLFINYWGSPWMAHPIVSFQFADALPVCFSIETRKEEGETYSAIGGIYRQYELICITADERDVVRVRTNYRKGEESYLYRTKITPDRARERFMEYVATINGLRERPRWYNAVTTNCTTAIRAQHPANERIPWDWRILVNGKGDEMMYERGVMNTDGLPFQELRAKALINEAARLDGGSADFSRNIRAGRPGFAGAPAPTP